MLSQHISTSSSVDIALKTTEVGKFDSNFSSAKKFVTLTRKHSRAEYIVKSCISMKRTCTNTVPQRNRELFSF